MIEILIQIGKGVVLGLVTTALGYAKNQGENFDLLKGVQTIIVGGVVGGFAGYTNLSFVAAQDYLVGIGAITIVEYVKKTIWRRWLSKYFTKKLPEEPC